MQTWTDLYSALMPQGLVKSGVIAGLAGSFPEAKRDPSLNAIQLAAFAGNVAAVKRVGGGALEPREARIGEDPRVHGAGAPRLPVRDRPGHAGVPDPQGAEGALPRAARPRSVDLPRRRHRIPDDPGEVVVRLPPPRRRLRRLARQRLHRARELRRPGGSERLAPADAALHGRLPRRDDLREDREGRAPLGSAPEARSRSTALRS